MVTKLFDISNVFKKKLHYHKLLREISIDNLKQVSPVQFTKLKVNKEQEPQWAGAFCRVSVLLLVVGSVVVVASSTCGYSDAEARLTSRSKCKRII